jgi:hypothetical protein
LPQPDYTNAAKVSLSPNGFPWSHGIILINNRHRQLKQGQQVLRHSNNAACPTVIMRKQYLRGMQTMLLEVIVKNRTKPI